MSNETKAPKKPRSNTKAFLMAIGVVLGGFIGFVLLIFVIVFVGIKKEWGASSFNGVFRVAMKANMYAIYARQTAFHAIWGTYTSDLSAVIQDTSSLKDLHFKYGFVEALVDPQLSSKFIGKLDVTRKDSDKLELATLKNTEPFDSVASKLCADCKASKDTFKILAFGNLDEDEALDVWTIDHERNLVHVADDNSENTDSVMSAERGEETNAGPVSDADPAKGAGTGAGPQTDQGQGAEISD